GEPSRDTCWYGPIVNGSSPSSSKADLNTLIFCLLDTAQTPITASDDVGPLGTAPLRVSSCIGTSIAIVFTLKPAVESTPPSVAIDLSLSVSKTPPTSM